MSQTSPISIGVPAGDEADLVLDMGASFGLGLELFESVPSLQGAFFKNLAVGTAERSYFTRRALPRDKTVWHPAAFDVRTMV